VHRLCKALLQVVVLVLDDGEAMLQCSSTPAYGTISAASLAAAVIGWHLNNFNTMLWVLMLHATTIGMQTPFCDVWLHDISMMP
jgi:hypothetical protein